MSYVINRELCSDEVFVYWFFAKFFVKSKVLSIWKFFGLVLLLKHKVLCRLLPHYFTASLYVRTWKYIWKCFLRPSLKLYFLVAMVIVFLFAISKDMLAIIVLNPYVLNIRIQSHSWGCTTYRSKQNKYSTVKENKYCCFTSLLCLGYTDLKWNCHLKKEGIFIWKL